MGKLINTRFASFDVKFTRLSILTLILFLASGTHVRSLCKPLDSASLETLPGKLDIKRYLIKVTNDTRVFFIEFISKNKFSSFSVICRFVSLVIE